MSEYRVRLVGGKDGEVATISTKLVNNRCHIGFHYREHVIEAEALDFFETFCQIRLQLEVEKLVPFCYGASLNVYPSGMARDMGKGLKAYRVTIGKPATMKDLVDIFDEGADMVPASVAEQKKHWLDWWESIKALPKQR